MGCFRAGPIDRGLRRICSDSVEEMWYRTGNLFEFNEQHYWKRVFETKFFHAKASFHGLRSNFEDRGIHWIFLMGWKSSSQTKWPKSIAKEEIKLMYPRIHRTRNLVVSLYLCQRRVYKGNWEDSLR